MRKPEMVIKTKYVKIKTKKSFLQENFCKKKKIEAKITLGLNFRLKY